MRLVIYIGILFFSSNLFALGEWELEKNANGIKVYTRKNEGDRIKQFKAVSTIFASRMKIAEVVTRITDYPNWYPHCGEAKVRKIVSSTERLVYYRVDLPWPADDRDCLMTMRVKVNKAKKETIIHFNNSEGEEKLSDAIRMTDADGFWKLTSLEDEKTKVTYQFSSDPGGNLPAWIINMFIVDGPYETFIELKKKVE